MSSIKSRLRRIEKAARGGRCPECAQPSEPAALVVYYEGEGRPTNADDRCPRCGRHLWTVIRVVEDGDDGGGVTPNG